MLRDAQGDKVLYTSISVYSFDHSEFSLFIFYDALKKLNASKIFHNCRKGILK
jgi:hypothetical protein